MYLKNNEQKKAGVRRAVALRYRPETDGVPVVVGAGEGFVAEKIIEKADENSIPVVPDPALSGALSKLAVGEYIPPELYEAVAQILVFIAEADYRYGRRFEGSDR